MTTRSNFFIREAGNKPKGFANGIVAEGRMVFLAGQVGWNAEQQFDSADFVAQARQALANIVTLVRRSRRQAGAHHAPDLVRHRQDRNTCRG